MLQFIVTLREGVEAALIVGITLAYLAKTGRSDLNKTVYSALGSALVASVLGAVFLAKTGINRDVFEGVVMLIAAGFVITMIVFMGRAARTLRGTIENKLGSLTEKGSRAGLFLFVFLMILREGVETVLFLAAVSLNSSELSNFMGTLLGIGLAVAFGVMFVKGSVRINLRKFFKVTTVILVFVVVQLVITGLHELSEARVIPSSRQEMALIGPIVRNDFFFPVSMLALAALMVLFEYRRRQPEALSAPSQALKRKQRWSVRRERLWMGSVYVTSLIFIVLITAEFIYAKSTTSLSTATVVQLVNDRVVIPTTGFADGDLHRYSVKVAGKEVRFLLFQKPGGKVVTVLDACQICGPVGFYRTSRGITCKNCASPVNSESVGERGGCNPIPINTTTTPEGITIAGSDLASAALTFSH